MQSRFLQSALACAGLSTLTFSPLVFAQSDSSLPEVVVTANRFEQRQAEEPGSMTVISASEILRSGFLTIQDILYQQAGINLIDTGSGPNKQIDLRGFGMSGDQNTLILLDGQRITENELASADLASVPLASIERIEILRGSGAVLFGRGATGGTINIITKKNFDRKNTATVQLQGGSFDTWGVTTSARIATDSVGIAVFADRNGTDNYRRNNQSQQQNLTADLTYFGQRGPVSLRVSTGNQSLGLPGERTREQLLSNPRGATTPNDYADLDTARVALSTEQRVDFGFFALDLTHRTRDATAFFASYMDNPTLTKANVSSISPRFRIPFTVAGSQHSAIVGMDWDRWNWRYLSREVDPNTVDATAHQINQSLYFRHTVDFESGTVVAIGARRQRVITEAVDFGDPGSQAKNVSATELSVRQALGNGWTLRAKTGTSFRLQTVDELIGRNWFPLKILQPQTSTDLEAGISYEYQANSVALNVYQSRVKNEIRYYSDAIQSGNFNLPPTSHQGVEMTGKWTVSPALSVGLNYAYTEAFFRSGEINGTAVTGKIVPLVPKHKLTTSLGWKLFERTNVNARLTYVDATRLDSDYDNASQFRRPAFTVADLILNHEVGNWRLRASALNLFNERYFTYGFLSGPSYSGYPAAGRGVFMSAEYRF